MKWIDKLSSVTEKYDSLKFQYHLFLHKQVKLRKFEYCLILFIEENGIEETVKLWHLLET